MKAVIIIHDQYLLLSRIHYHKKTIRAAVSAQEEDWGISTTAISEQSEKLQNHNFRLEYEASSQRAIVNSWANWLLIAALFALVLLVTLGCAFPSFSIEILGLLGLGMLKFHDVRL